MHPWLTPHHPSKFHWHRSVCLHSQACNDSTRHRPSCACDKLTTCQVSLCHSTHGNQPLLSTTKRAVDAHIIHAGCASLPPWMVACLAKPQQQQQHVHVARLSTFHCLGVHEKDALSLKAVRRCNQRQCTLHASKPLTSMNNCMLLKPTGVTNSCSTIAPSAATLSCAAVHHRLPSLQPRSAI